MLLATFALRETDATMAEYLKAIMRRLGVRLGLLANFHDVKLEISAVRLKESNE